MLCWGRINFSQVLKELRNLHWKDKLNPAWQEKKNMSDSFGFQCPHNRLLTLWVEASPRAEQSAWTQRKCRGCGSALWPTQHHLQHGRVPHLLLRRPCHTAHLQVHPGQSLMVLLRQTLMNWLHDMKNSHYVEAEDSINKEHNVMGLTTLQFLIL